MDGNRTEASPKEGTSSQEEEEEEEEPGNYQGQQTDGYSPGTVPDVCCILLGGVKRAGKRNGNFSFHKVKLSAGLRSWRTTGPVELVGCLPPVTGARAGPPHFL